jgi:uncharacterized protein YutE (UPF0331/DUF86 family)
VRTLAEAARSSFPRCHPLAVDRHLRRVAEKLPQNSEDLTPGSDASDAVFLHLWLAVQLVIDLATAICVNSGLGAPDTYRDAFERLARAGKLDADLADRVARAAGFRNLVAHAYENIDVDRVHATAVNGPRDLRAFLKAASRIVEAANPGS